MLKTIQSAKNLLLSIAEDAEVGRVGSGGGDCEDETIKRLLSKNSNGADYRATDAKKGNKSTRNFEYLISDAKSTFNQLRQAFTEAPIL